MRATQDNQRVSAQDNPIELFLPIATIRKAFKTT
jgi:hypothetical protein